MVNIIVQIAYVKRSNLKRERTQKILVIFKIFLLLLRQFLWCHFCLLLFISSIALIKHFSSFCLYRNNHSSQLISMFTERYRKRQLTLVLYSRDTTIRIHIHAETKSTIMTNEHTSLEKYTSHTLFERVVKGLCVRGVFETEKTATYWPPVPLTIAALLSHSAGLLNRGSWGPKPSAGSWFSLPQTATRTPTNGLQLTDSN